MVYDCMYFESRCHAVCVHFDPSCSATTVFEKHSNKTEKGFQIYESSQWSVERLSIKKISVMSQVSASRSKSLIFTIMQVCSRTGKKIFEQQWDILGNFVYQ
mgnify:CR=1 FL=1